MEALALLRTEQLAPQPGSGAAWKKAPARKRCSSSHSVYFLCRGTACFRKQDGRTGGGGRSSSPPSPSPAPLRRLLPWHRDRGSSHNPLGSLRRGPRPEARRPQAQPELRRLVPPHSLTHLPAPRLPRAAGPRQPHRRHRGPAQRPAIRARCALHSPALKAS